MPMNLEYVLISYGLWVLAFVIYIPWIKQKRKVFQQSLKTQVHTSLKLSPASSIVLFFAFDIKQKPCKQAFL